MSDLGIGLAADPAADVSQPRAGDPVLQQAYRGGGGAGSFTPGQQVELAVQVGSWKEGTPCEIINQERPAGQYEWRVIVHRDVGGPVDASVYEHELRPRKASRLEKLCARVDPDYVAWEETWGKLHNEMADGEDPFGAAVDALYTEAQDVLLRKHAMYGPKNVAQAPGGAINGLRVRIWDKVARLNNLVDKDIDDPDFESLRDTFLDLANYALIGCLVLNGDWPNG